MSEKWGRNYTIQIKTSTDKLVTITPPISVVLEVDRSIKGSSLSNSSVTIYNLGPQTRNIVYKDIYTKQEYWQIIIKAGYGDKLYTIFQGNIQEAYSYKEKTEWITKLDCFDGNYQVQNGFVNTTVNAGIDLKSMITNQVMPTMKNMLTGLFGTPVTEAPVPGRGTVLVGNSYEELQKLTGGNAFISGETVHVLGDNEVLPGDVFYLGPDDFNVGTLFTTPKRRDTYLEVDCLFAPEIELGRIVQIESAFPKYNGQYKVFGVKHSVTISQASAGDAKTSLSLFIGEKALQEIKQT
jgi:hypothetical protein